MCVNKGECKMRQRVSNASGMIGIFIQENRSDHSKLQKKKNEHLFGHLHRIGVQNSVTE